MDDPLGALAEILRDAGVDYALIGGHAVNAWLEPRFTADIDFTVSGGTTNMSRLETTLEKHGFSITDQYGIDQTSGPDFVRFSSVDARLVLEFQAAKTQLQQDVIQRACQDARGLRVATPEDLIVLKLIANRSKDQIDLIGLCQLPNLDWEYVERCAGEWELSALLESFRNS